MIGMLSGVVAYRASDHVMLDVRGVGYIVHCSDRTLAALPGAGEATVLYTDLLVREDLLQLFGFSTLLEKEWHRLLLSVQGIGAKASLSILSALGAEGVGRAIALGDWSAVRAAQGVGPKIAQRVVNELKDKAPQVMALGGDTALIEVVGAASGGIEPPSAARPSAGAGAAPRAATGTGAAAQAAAQAAALSALINLGYGQGEAAGAVAEAAGVGAEDEAALIRAALRLLAPKG